MKNKNIVLILIAALILIISVILLIIFTTNKSSINIKQYETGSIFYFKNININNDNVIKKYVKQLKPLSDSEMVDLMLLKDIEIEYNDDLTIIIQLEEKNYCYYINKKENISSLSKMPKGLYEWVKEKIQ